MHLLAFFHRATVGALLIATAVSVCCSSAAAEIGCAILPGVINYKGARLPDERLAV
jgi:hypothetical protein